MKIVIINGSARRGNTLTAINAFIKGASEKNEIEIIQPDRLHIAPCKGCGVCQCYKGCSSLTASKVAVRMVLMYCPTGNFDIFFQAVITDKIDTILGKFFCTGFENPGNDRLIG